MSFSHKMEKLIEDALNVHKLLPWIETEEDIINFMRRIPLDKVHMRKQLALYYFLKEKDVLNDNEQKIEDEAREIIVVLPYIPYRDIKERLRVLGSTPNRKEIVIRQLLVLEKDLGKIVSDIVSAKKRRSENIFDMHNSNDETNIKIKIRKIEGALKVVSSIKQEKVSTVPYHSSSEEEDSTSHSSSSLDMNHVDRIQSKIPVRQQPNLNDIRTFNISSTENNVNPYLPSSSNLNSMDITVAENAIPQFDLVGYLQDITCVSNKKIKSLCRRYHVGLSEKPSEDVLHQLLDDLMAPEVIQLDDTTSSGSSCTEEYFDEEMDYLPQGQPQQMAPVRQRYTIWQGLLEWKRKNATDQQTITKHVPFQISCSSKDGNPELKADGWPTKLIMQLMPKKLIGNIGAAYLKNSKSVLFHPQPCDALELFTRVMSSGFAGCVHFTSIPTPACDIKVLILFYNADKRVYLGYIPNDQGAFVERLRTVIQQQKSMHQQMIQGGPAGPSMNPPIELVGTSSQMGGANPATSQNAQQNLPVSQTNTIAMGGGQITQNVSTNPQPGQTMGGIVGQNVVQDHVEEPNRSCTAAVKIGDAEMFTVQIPSNGVPEVEIEDVETVTAQIPADAVPEVEIEDAEPVTVQTPADAMPAPVHVEPRTYNVQVGANEPAVQTAPKFSLRPSSFNIGTNKRAFIVPPKFIPPNLKKPKSDTPDVLPAFPQDVLARINRTLAALEEEQLTVEPGNNDNNLLEPSTSKDSERNKRVEAWLDELTTSAQPAKRNVETEETFEAMPSTSTASITQHEPVPSTSKDSDSSTELTMDAYSKVDENLFLRLIEIFPQACPDYLKSVIRTKSSAEFSTIVSYILSMDDYPKRPERVNSPPAEMDFEDQLDMVKALLPDADPQYLHLKCLEFSNNVEGLNQFINDARESGDYPTMKEYLRNQQISAQTKQYTTEFNVEKFVELFPDPRSTFSDPNRSINIDGFSHGYLLNFFLNKYDRLHLRTIKTILLRNNYKMLASDKEMSNCVHAKQIMKSRRKPTKMPEPGQNILFLQELAYVEHIDEIEAFIESKKAKTEEERLYAKENGLMQTCQCCYDDEVMPNNTFECPKGCKFCGDCIKKSCEIAFGEGTIDFKCLTECNEEFTLQTLQNVLPPKMFSKVAQKKALAEVKAAGIEELVSCPFCDFANIPAENDKIFRCLNPECMKESCLQCKEPNHLPLRCDEIEKDNDVKARVFVENQMTEALLRKCWKCGTNFFKEEGCNKMTCTCGAKMCYVCRKPVTDYSHFNGIGGDKFELCPLYTNTNEDNQRAVLQAAKAAKAQIDPANLKVDPSADVEEHYKKRVAALPREPHIDLINNAELHRIQLARGNLQRLQLVNEFRRIQQDRRHVEHLRILNRQRAQDAAHAQARQQFNRR